MDVIFCDDRLFDGDGRICSDHPRLSFGASGDQEHHRSPLPGLTRQSILLKRLLFLMDARVKPAHDDSK